MLIQIIILLLEIFLIFGGTSVFVIGQSLTTLFGHKWKTLNHFSLMVKKIYQVAPNKMLTRLCWAFIIAFVVYCLLTQALLQDNIIQFGKLNFPTIIACVNTFIFLVSVLTLFFTNDKKNQERDWREVRLSAHARVYGKYPSFREYATW